MLVRCVSVLAMLTMTVPLTVFGWWDLGFGLTAKAALYIAGSACITWLIAFNAYYYALRSGKASAVAPVTSTDPIWTAVFAALILGVALTTPTVVGLLVATAGIALVGRWMDAGGEAAAAPDVGWAVAPDEAVQDPGDTRLKVIVLALITAAGWGLSPVIIQLAEKDNGGASAGMMLESQTLGLLLVLGIILVRHEPILVRPITADERRSVIRLLVVAGIFEAIFAVLYYVLIAEIGAVLTVLIGATSPLFTLLGSVLFLKERVGLRLALATVVTLLGVAIATLGQ
jgi:drug/metabolite transporter (DMT)-like permease